MMRSLTLMAVAAMCLSGTFVEAQSVNCDRAADQASMNFCADQGYKVADQQLNAAYRALSRDLGRADLARLKTAQRSWIAYRDQMCDFVASASQGGSVYPMVLSNCLAEVTNSQTDVLQSQANCQEGDVSCVRR